MESEKILNLLNKAKHIIIALLGGVLIGVANGIDNNESIFYDIFLGLGTNLIAFAFVFFVFEYFETHPQVKTNSDELEEDSTTTTQNDIESVPENLRGSITSRSTEPGLDTPIRDFDGE